MGITEDYVSFETATLLNKKGFDTVTEKCYILNNSGLCAVEIELYTKKSPQSRSRA